ncbi:MAG: ABC transporter ATP-binding protein [Candidatus Faecousia sp.]|uniref:ABC transporter ATP-binding protein n=1 Tax=Faecousia sp. TaxID=2952921 RepID=UPI002A8867DC|nr:ABC transporter ATP-binding protein [Candidatus Faecousia sp.]
MKKHTVRRVLLLIRPYRFTVVGSLLLALASVASQLLIPIFSGRAIDAMVGKGRVDLDAVALAVAAIALIALLGAFAQDMLARCNNRITFSVSRDLRSRISCKLNRLPLSYLDTHPTGDTVSRTVADVEAFADGLLMGFTQLFTGVLTVLATLVVMLVLNWRIALAVCLLTPLSIFIAKYITSRTSRFFRAQARIRGEQTALINELIEGQRVVRAFGHEAAALADFDAVNDRLEKASLSATFFSSLTNPTTRLANNLVYAVVTLISALNAIAGGISVGQVSVFLSYASQYAKPFNEISGVVTELQNALTCADRVFELLDLPDEQPDCADPVSPEARGAVRLDKVCFRYVPERPLISDFSLDVRPGQRIAIVGPTGCGKTTLINLLMRFYDVDSGAISVDGADIRRITRHDLRGRYGMVLQDTWLATATVRENITYGKPDATDAEIEAAAKAAYAHSFIRRLPQGYDTVIRENDLSAGQRQLICIARAMLCLPPMLILDEATSSIDTRTELKIQAAFAKMMAGRTSFIVAHRLSTVREADVILVMKDGHIIEKGNHAELLARNGFYATLYNSQFAG